MTDFQKGMLNLIKSALDGVPAALPENFDWVMAYKTAKKHQILPIFYYGCANTKVSINYEIYSKIEMAVFKATALSTKQMYELQQLFEAFKEAGISFMPLKGTLLKPLFPRPEMRMMGDADILIKLDEYDKIRPIMLSLGFTEQLESDHELVWNKPGALLVELHKHIIPSYNKDYYAYFGDGWRLAQKTDSSRYVMRDEDNFIYLFTHFSKHYRDGGIGIRHLLDFEVFLNKKPNLDFDYINAELEKLELLEFYKNIKKTLAVWFRKGEGDDVTELITATVFGSGPYGTDEAHKVASATRTAKSEGEAKNVIRKKKIQMVFLPYKNMCLKYPFLRQWAILLPLMWVVRAFDILFNRRENIKKNNQNLNSITDESINVYQNNLHKVGLDFNFEE